MLVEFTAQCLAIMVKWKSGSGYGSYADGYCVSQPIEKIYIYKHYKKNNKKNSQLVQLLSYTRYSLCLYSLSFTQLFITLTRFRFWSRHIEKTDWSLQLSLANVKCCEWRACRSSCKWVRVCYPKPQWASSWFVWFGGEVSWKRDIYIFTSSSATKSNN